MSAQHIVALVSRLFAIWLGINAIAQLAMISGAQGGTGALGNALYIMPLITASVALLVWFFPLAIANKLVPRTQHDNLIGLPAPSVAALATAALGLWTILQVIPDLVGVVHEASRGPRLTGGDFLFVLLPFLRLGIGLFLLNKPWIIADKLVPGASRQK